MGPLCFGLYAAGPSNKQSSDCLANGSTLEEREKGERREKLEQTWLGPGLQRGDCWDPVMTG